MNIYNLPPLIATFTNFFIFAFLILKKKKDAVHILFSLFCLSLAVWNFGAFLSFFILSINWAILGIKINSAGLVFIPATFLSFVFAFVGKKIKIFMLLFLFSLSTVFLLFSLTTKLFFSDIIYRFWGYYPIGGPINMVFAVYLIICVVYGSGLLYKYLKGSKGIKHTQATYIFFGFLIAFGGGFINLLPVSGVNIYPVGNVINIFYTAIITYAIVKHRLMDIEIVVKKSIVYSLIASSVGGTYVLLSFIFGQVLQDYIGYSNFLAIILTSLIVTLGYKPLETFIENTTDRIFFRSSYDYRKGLKELSKEIATVIDLHQLLELIVMGIAKMVKVDKVSMLIRQAPDKWDGLMCKHIKNKSQIKTISLQIDGVFTNFLSMYIAPNIEPP